MKVEKRARDYLTLICELVITSSCHDTFLVNETMRNFHKIDEAFVCENCGKSVEKAGNTCRNHCPFCLTSKHVDINPGDRANPCQGKLVAFSYELSAKKGLVLIFRCARCGAITKNKAKLDGPGQLDDYDKILKLTVHQS